MYNISLVIQSDTLLIPDDADWITSEILHINFNKLLVNNEASRYFIYFKVDRLNILFLVFFAYIFNFMKKIFYTVHSFLVVLTVCHEFIHEVVKFWMIKLCLDVSQVTHANEHK